MSLSNRLYDYGKNTAYALAIATSLLTPDYSQAQAPRNSQPSQQKLEQKVEEKVPSFNEFRGIMTKRGRYQEKDKKLFESYWKGTQDKEKTRLYEFYLRPEEAYKRLSEKQKQEFDKYYGVKLTEEEIKYLNKAYENSFPWKVDFGKLSLSDQLMIYFSKSNKN